MQYTCLLIDIQMKKILFFALVLLGSAVSGQVLNPVISFSEDPDSYCMHICSDGQYYYTINGGVAEQGKVFKYNLDGTFIAKYPLRMDMRSIMYSRKDKSLYISNKNKEIYKVIDIASGTVQLVHANIFENEQSSLAMDPNGRYIYALDNGSLAMIDLKKGTVVKKMSGFKCGNKGMKGSTTVAVDSKYLYTWDADLRAVYVYDKKGIYRTSFTLRSGNMGHTLSVANGIIFVASSEKGKLGNWYGYKLKVN